MGKISISLTPTHSQFRSTHKIPKPHYRKSYFYSPWNHSKFLFACKAAFMNMDTTIMKGKTMNIIEQKQYNASIKDIDYDAYNYNGYLASLLQSCVKAKSLTQGQMLHAHILKSEFESDCYLENKLIDMYAKLGSLEDARQVFDKMPQRNMVSWTLIISGYAKGDLGEDAFYLFVEMLNTGLQPNEFTYTSVLRGCVDMEMGGLEEGKQIHAHVIKTLVHSYIAVSNALVDMYGKCGNITFACKVFDKMRQRDRISWNTMISGYARCGHGEEAFKMFARMYSTGIRPDQLTLSSVLVALALLLSLEEGKNVHGIIVRSGFGSKVNVNNALITMYAKCGDVESAARVFDEMPERDVISWTSMITGYTQHGLASRAFQLFQEMPAQNSVSYSAMIAGFAQNGEGDKAIHLFRKMQDVGIRATHFTIASVVNACADLATIKRGKQLHAHIIKTGIEASVCIGGALVDMYGKCGVMLDAHKAFDKMPEKNVVSWNGMITAYAQNGQGGEALSLFDELQIEDTIVDQFTLASVLGACGTLGAMGEGQKFHAQILKYGLGLEVGICNALVTMYVKCGSIEEALRVFGEMCERDVISWNAMIIGFAQHGRGKEALQFFQQMQDAGMEPNGVTFIGVLSACKRLRLVDEGHYYFDSMSKYYGITPSIEHYAAMVDILGGVGCLTEAYKFINQMPIEPGMLVWRSLFRACRVHGNVELAKHAVENIIRIEPDDPATYALVSNIYASVGWWDNAKKVRRMMKNRGVKKLPARSWIFRKRKIHSFLSRDRAHPQTEDIHAKLGELIMQIKEAGYEPDTSIVVHDVEPHHKEHFLMYHSEKLAVAFGLLITPPDMPIRVTKSVCICHDCHTFTKFVSKTVGKEIIVRDASGFHYFKDGYCLCGDYW